MNSDLEEIKSRLNIIDVLGEYIRLEKAGSNYRALCPFHNEKSPSFMVSEERQMWKCFGCQKGGDIFSFVMEIEGLEFRDALKQLAEKAGIKLAGYDPKKIEVKNRTLEILELVTKWYEYQLWKGPGKIKILKYLRERGLNDETIKEFRLGYAPKGWRNILTFLLSRGFKADEIKKTGLLVEKKDTQISNSQFPISNKIPNLNSQNTKYYDRFRERIMFPISDYSGKVVGYSARVAPGGDESQAKYVNTPETEVYHKSNILYGLDKAKSNIKE
ncbi:MAG TPA: CHC2 zinc finger domain-containing protein, partial [Patescibacteria group bacterium]|nr:CHC2 zinc finger domain-containing protein [Patescibacteria group bacterium]